MKKKINIPLILVTIVIWGFIIYSVAEAVWFNAEDDRIKDNAFENNLEKRNESTQNSIFEFEYIDKNPFASTHIEKKVNISTITQSTVKEFEREEPIIQFSVGGVVINGDSKKIVFNDNTHSNVVFLEEGDLYQGLKVIKVTKNQVEFLHLKTGDKLTSQIQ
jgi:hypothetical protein